MSRTIRNKAYGLFGCIRKPKTHNEIMNITGIITDIKVDEYADYPLSGVNRMHRRKNIPTSWDDIPFSSAFEHTVNTLKSNRKRIADLKELLNDLA